MLLAQHLRIAMRKPLKNSQQVRQQWGSNLLPSECESNYITAKLSCSMNNYFDITIKYLTDALQVVLIWSVILSLLDLIAGTKLYRCQYNRVESFTNNYSKWWNVYLLSYIRSKQLQKKFTAVWILNINRMINSLGIIVHVFAPVRACGWSSFIIK